MSRFIQSRIDAAIASCAAGPWIEGEPPKDGEWHNLLNNKVFAGTFRFDGNIGYWIADNGKRFPTRGFAIVEKLPPHTHHARINPVGE